MVNCNMCGTEMEEMSRDESYAGEPDLVRYKCPKSDCFGQRNVHE